MKQIESYVPNIGDQAAKVTEASFALSKSGGYNFDAFKKCHKELKDAGIDLNKPGLLERMTAKSQNISLSAASNPAQSVIGTQTFEISNQLIQDISPEAALENSPYNIMMPFKTVDAQYLQQDIMASFYGYADGGSTVNGAHNIVPLLETFSNQYEGFPIDEMSELEGNDLIALRAVGTNDTRRRGALQKLNYGMLNLLYRAGTGLELNRIESLFKGSWTWYNGALDDNVIISSQIPAGNVTTLSQSLGSYVTSTNTFTPNASLTVNPLVQLGQMLTSIKNTGADIEKIVIDNITYGAIFSSSAVTSQTQYVSTHSDNNVMDIRRNLFRITTIPALQGIDIEVDNRALKINPNTTSRSNTRPLLWGKTVTTSSFRALVIVRPKGLSRVGDFGFFPNVYERTTNILGGSKSNGGYGGGIVMAQQDLSQMDITKQKIQLLAASNSAPMIYLPNMVYVFDFNVTVS